MREREEEEDKTEGEERQDGGKEFEERKTEE